MTELNRKIDKIELKRAHNAIRRKIDKLEDKFGVLKSFPKMHGQESVTSAALTNTNKKCISCFRDITEERYT